MIDIDHFKEINDNHSHEVGDKVLAQLATLLHEHAVSMAPAGFCARLGGEEFLLVAPAVVATTAVASLQQLQHLVATHGWARVPARVRPTISTGLVITANGGQESPTVLAHADQMLYLAKRNGRNRVETIVLGDTTR